MARVDGFALSRWYSKSVRQILAFWWLLGLLGGIVLFRYAEFPVVSVMRRVVFAPVSIVGLFSNLLIPFLFSVFTVSFAVWWTWVLCFLEGCRVSFVFMGLYTAFGSAGWLIPCLLLPGSLVSTAACYLLWQRLLAGEKILAPAVGSVAAAALAYAAEYCVISPFLASLIIH